MAKTNVVDGVPICPGQVHGDDSVDGYAHARSGSRCCEAGPSSAHENALHRLHVFRYMLFRALHILQPDPTDSNGRQ
jgi:hypothetical protein